MVLIHSSMMDTITLVGCTENPHCSQDKAYSPTAGIVFSPKRKSYQTALSCTQEFFLYRMMYNVISHFHPNPKRPAFRLNRQKRVCAMIGKSLATLKLEAHELITGA